MNIQDLFDYMGTHKRKTVGSFKAQKCCISHNLIDYMGPHKGKKNKLAVVKLKSV